MSNTEAKMPYKLASGLVVPGVTTIVGILDKHQLIPWANRLGLQGIDCMKERDDKGTIGSLVHSMILADLKGEEVDLADYSQNQIQQAENSYLYYLDWLKGKTLEPVVVETMLISEKYKFGGTPDYYGKVDGELCLIDYKSGFVGDEAYIQTCAYQALLAENNYPIPNKIIILRIPRGEDDKYEEIILTDYEPGWEMFLHLREAYELRKTIKKIMRRG